MAIHTDASQAAMIVIEALTAYAERKGWAPAEYRLFVGVSATWGSIYVTFRSDHFVEPQRRKYSDSIMDFLETRLDEYPSIFNSIRLLLRPLDDRDGDAWSMDQDFEVVYTTLPGPESLVQSAGRIARRVK